MEKKKNYNISNPNSRNKFEKLDTWWAIRFHSLKRDKNKKFWKIYYNFLLTQYNLVKPAVLQIYILYSNIPKFKRHSRGKINQQDSL